MVNIACMNAQTAIAVCVAGAPRTFYVVSARMAAHLHGLRPDVYMAIATSKQRFLPSPLCPVVVSLVPTPVLELKRKSHMAYTMKACAPMIEAGERGRQHSYSWIIRMRTDVYYDFDWVPGPVPQQTRAVWSNYIGGCYTCSKHVAHCINDEWNVLPRLALRAFFVDFYKEYNSWTPFKGALSRCPECLLGWILWKHGLDRRNFSVSVPIVRRVSDVSNRTVFQRVSLQNIVVN